MKIKFYKTKSFNPYYNLALEDFLFDLVSDANCAVLYFWQNADTVVIGRNQDAQQECNLNMLFENNIFLARRKTGGGAVFHDKNNLNFSFIVPKEVYDKKKSMEIIARAISNLGIETEISGRNDILTHNRKFSGNAYYNSKNSCLHHGTILINTDFEKLTKILTPDISKLKSKGVKSVKMRVINLSEIKNIAVRDICREIKNEFLKFYGRTNVDKLKLTKMQKLEVAKKRRFFASDKWLLGKYEEYLFQKEKKFPWGRCVIKKNAEGVFKLFSDSLETKDVENAQNILNGIAIHNIKKDSKIIKDILEFADKKTK